MPAYYHYNTVTSDSTYTWYYTYHNNYIWEYKPTPPKPKLCEFCKSRVETEKIGEKSLEVCTECYRVQE